ncbi:hypothetical protein [Micromonospora craniellae]|uniref:hypothetical protein n=1 Tax=Micromonospora craniellae TaxID=2294034 RepID=UPI001CC5FC68|nr:hypothetical protein [Micromonospora craniellae]
MSIRKGGRSRLRGPGLRISSPARLGGIDRQTDLPDWKDWLHGQLDEVEKLRSAPGADCCTAYVVMPDYEVVAEGGTASWRDANWARVRPTTWRGFQPRGPWEIFVELVNTCVAVTGAGTVPVWAEPDWLVGQGVQQWTELPLWRTHRGAWAVDSSRAVAAGLACRPLSDTVSQTWAWMTGGGSAITGEGEAGRAADHGLSASRERELLKTWLQNS